MVVRETKKKEIKQNNIIKYGSKSKIFKKTYTTTWVITWFLFFFVDGGSGCYVG